MFTMPLCYCLHPVIIKNHVDKYINNPNDWKIILRGNEVLFAPAPKRAKITKDDLEESYYYNVYSGEMIPIYIEVPCGKCLLCSEKKANEWSVRMLAESQYHDNCPWWITLTYNNLSLPPDGLRKKDLSNFLKRLRERVSRLVGKDVRLRFVACGEYGGNYARAHYHLILYGMPKMCATKVLLMLENAWSKRVSKSVYNELLTDFRFVRLDKNNNKMYYQRIGFVYVKPAHDNTPMYLAKYMYKPQLNTPDGKNPNFHLASRKNGIGYDYVIEYRDFHRMHPNHTQITILNKWTGKSRICTIPNYFKDYWFPTASMIIPNEVKKEIDLFRIFYSEFITIKKMLSSDAEVHDDADSLVSDINAKYNFFPTIVPFEPVTFKDDLICEYKRECYDYIDDSKIYTNFDCFMQKKYLEYYFLLQRSYQYIMSLEFDTDALNWTVNLRDVYKSEVSNFMRSQPQIDLKEVESSILRSWRRRKAREMQ